MENISDMLMRATLGVGCSQVPLAREWFMGLLGNVDVHLGRAKGGSHLLIGQFMNGFASEKTGQLLQRVAGDVQSVSRGQRCRLGRRRSICKDFSSLQ